MALLPALATAANDLSQAQAAVQQQRWPAAQTHLETWLNRHADDEEARFLLARVLSWQGNFTAALQEYDRLLAKSPHNADYLLGNAQVLFWQDQPDAALPLLERARHVAPDYAAVWQLSVKALAATGRKAEAAAMLQQAARRFPASDWSGVLPPPEPAAITAPQPFRPSTEVGLAGTYEKLDHKYASWNSVALSGSHRLGERDSIYGGLEEADRFDLTDMGMQAGVTRALSERWTGTLEGFGSPTHHFLARWNALGGLHYQFDGGWGVGATFKHAAYVEQNNDTGAITFEKYQGNFRIAYTLYISQLQTAAEPAFSHMGQLSYYYDDHSRIGIGIGGGQQAVRLGPARIINADTEAYTLFGQHWLDGRWALTYEAGLNMQGTSYTRKGGGFGIRYLF